MSKLEGTYQDSVGKLEKGLDDIEQIRKEFEESMSRFEDQYQTMLDLSLENTEYMTMVADVIYHIKEQHFSCSPIRPDLCTAKNNRTFAEALKMPMDELE